MKRFTLLLILAALLAACDNASQSPPASLPTPLPPVPTASTDGQQPTAEQEPTATGAALATLPASPTAETPTEAPPAVEPKQGGCGCNVVGINDNMPLGGAIALAFGAVVVVRRRRFFQR